MDYKNGKIYTLRSHQTDNIYIGSTASLLPKRLYQHKNNYKQYLKEKYNYVTAFEIIKFDDCYIELLEDCPCENKNQLLKREGQLIRAHDCVNKNVPKGLEKTEYIKVYRDEHKEEINAQQKQYYQDNKEEIIAQKKEYYQNNKEKLKENYQNNKEQKKEYYQNNKEKLNEPINCECGGKYTYQHKSQHFKSQNHKKYLQSSSN